MIILTKNKHRLQIDDFNFKCCIGKGGISSKKIEGDKKTPKGTFSIGNLYYRSDRLKKPVTKLKTIKIQKKFGWCDDVNFPLLYNKFIKLNNKLKLKHEKLFRHDHKYDLVLPIKYNFNKPRIPKGSCIFIHLTNNYKPTAGCIAIKKNDFLVLLKLVKPSTKIMIN